MTAPAPTNQDAINLVTCCFDSEVETIDRFPTGLAHYVYDVLIADGQRVVVRMNRTDQGADFAGAIYWQRLLRPRGVPLPSLLHYNVQPADGSFPFMIMERLSGRDLQDEYSAMTENQKRALARQITRIQSDVGEMELGPGFGYARSYDDGSLHPAWVDVLRAELVRSRQRIEKADVVSAHHVDRVERKLSDYIRYLAAVQPRCFLDDTTTKNVIVHKGRLSGIVDVDCVCFGDPLLTVALTQMSLLSSEYDTDYITYWVDELHLTSDQHAILTLYTAMFCVNFLAELGQRFNRNTTIPADAGKIDHLVALLDQLLTQL